RRRRQGDGHGRDREKPRRQGRRPGRRPDHQGPGPHRRDRRGRRPPPQQAAGGQGGQADGPAQQGDESHHLQDRGGPVTMKRFIFGLTLFLVALPLAAQTKDAPKGKDEKKEETKPVVVPFETLPSGHMTVMVKLNGKGPYKLIFDTGAPTLL